MIKTSTWCPRSVLVAGFPIEIKTMASLKVNEVDSWGSFEANSQTINLCEEFPSFIFGASILFHELVHAMYWVRGLKNRETEEDICTNAAPFLVALFKDNPELRKLVTRLK